jgi:hypothetical protein
MPLFTGKNDAISEAQKGETDRPSIIETKSIRVGSAIRKMYTHLDLRSVPFAHCERDRSNSR